MPSRIPAFFWALLIASAISNASLFLLPFKWQNDQYPLPGHSEQPAILQIECNPNCTAKNPNPIGNTRWFTRIIDKAIDDPATFGILMANFLLVLAVLSQVGEARKSSERQLRAYISVEPGITLRQNQKLHTRFEFRPNIINNGRTPAGNVRVLSRTEFGTGMLPSNFDYTFNPIGLPPGSIAAIGPNKDKFQSAVFFRNLTWVELRELAKGTKCFHLWGRVTYEDIFKIERHTNFSFLIFVSTKKNVQVIWHSTEHNNFYD
jgi:hypothetical protein